VADLERDNVLLKQDIDGLSKQVSSLKQSVSMHKRAANGEQLDQWPEGWNPDLAVPAGDANRPDILLLSIDTLRADHLGAWGYDRDTSPFMDKLAGSGTRYDKAWAAAPWTLPSHTTILSGLLPPHHGAIEDKTAIDKDIPLVQEAFKHAGYSTAGVVSTLFVSKRFGFDRGFDHFEDFEIEGAKMNNAATVDAGHVFAHATDWAQEQPEGKPLFLFLHVYDVHYGYNAPAPFHEKFDRGTRPGDAHYKDYQHYKKRPLSAEQMDHQIAQYDEEIAYVDDSLRIFLDHWRATRPNTIIAITSDHGEEFGERNSWGHAHTLFPEQLHVPMLVNGPGIRTQVVRERFGSEDIANTLAGLAGIAFPKGDGVDRTTQLARGGKAAPADHVPGRFAETSRFQTLRYRWHAPPYDLIVDLGNARRGLCHLDDDPGCENLALGDRKDIAEDLFGQMIDYLGQPWEAKVAGEVQVKGGLIYQGVNRQRKNLEVQPGDRFAVHPIDATVVLLAEDGESSGPWAAVGLPQPGDDEALGFHGRAAGDTTVELTDQEREMLEALGYLQDN
jgi:arylsulfatase A-like enzyme